MILTNSDEESSPKTLKDGKSAEIMIDEGKMLERRRDEMIMELTSEQRMKEEIEETAD